MSQSGEQQAGDETEDTGMAMAPESGVEDAGAAEEERNQADDTANASVSEEEKKRPGWLQRLKAALSRSSGKIGQGIAALFTKRRLDDDTLEELEDLLIQSDLGVETAARLTAGLAKGRYDKEIEAEEVKQVLADQVTEILEPVTKPLEINPELKPHVVLVVGVNGSGKTTTIGKIAKEQRGKKRKVMLAAGDTFRAAAVEQLQVWGKRVKCPVIARETGTDAASLAFEALEAAQKEKCDLLLIDTAGRLHNRADLMAELEKILRVIRKRDPSAPHDILLVLDATIGQNAHQQVEAFQRMVNVSGLALTKLDGSARGGVVVALAEKYKLPIHYVGVGEGADDLRPFDATHFARSLMGLEQTS